MGESTPVPYLSRPNGPGLVSEGASARVAAFDAIIVLLCHNGLHYLRTGRASFVGMERTPQCLRGGEFLS